MYDNRKEFGQRSFAPVKVGEELDVRIEAVGEKGDGVCKKKGFVIFVPNVKEGDEVRIRVTKVLRKVGFGEVIGEPQGPIEVDDFKPRKDNFGDASMETEGMEEPKEKQQFEDSEDFGEENAEDSESFDEEASDEEQPEEDSEEPSEEEKKKGDDEDQEAADSADEEDSEEPSDEELPEEDAEEEPSEDEASEADEAPKKKK